MFTPQRKPFPGSATAMTTRNTRSSVKGKGKSVAFADDLPGNLPPPPVSSLGKEVVSVADEDEAEDWRRFKEAGFLDEAELEKRDRQALQDRVTKLEEELFDYQHSMGLLLLEKKEWDSKQEELRQMLAETQEILKREKSANLMSLSEAERREENLRKALDLEKQCVADFQKALLDMQAERAQNKTTSEVKVAEATALVGGIEGKSLEVEQKMCAAELKLEEVNRKLLEVDIKLEELDARERALQRERLSLATEQEAHQTIFFKEREDLHEWNKKLQEQEQRLSELQRTLNQKEQKANENDRMLNLRERRLEDIQKKTDSSCVKLKDDQDEIKKKLADLTVKEKEADAFRNNLELKEKELHALEEKLTLREKIELQKLLDEQRIVLDRKMQEFDLEQEERRKSLDNELKSKMVDVEQVEADIKHREEKLKRQEEGLSIKLERYKGKDVDLAARLKHLKEREKSINSEEKRLDLQKQELQADIERLRICKDEVDKVAAETRHQEQQIREEHVKLEIAREERSEHLRLQSELKEQIDSYRCQEQLLLKELDDLKQERVRFEKEWEVLDEKRVEIDKQQRDIIEKKERLERMQRSEEERLKNEETSMRDAIARESEVIKLEKQAFEGTMKHEKAALSENAQSERFKLLQDIEMQKANLEADLRGRLDQLQREQQDTARAFEDHKERELTTIRRLKADADKDLEEVRSERLALGKSKEEVARNKDTLKQQQLDMQKDIGELEILSRSIKKQREHFIHERRRFTAFVEKLKHCKNCGELIDKFVLSDLQLSGMDDSESIPFPQVEDKLFSHHQGHLDALVTGNSKATPVSYEKTSEFLRPMSWVRQCTSNFLSISPAKKSEEMMNTGNRGEYHLHGDGTMGSLRKPDGVVSAEPTESGLSRRLDDGIVSAVNDYSEEDSRLLNAVEDSQQSGQQSVRRGRGKKLRSGLHRTRTVKDVIEDAKQFLGESQEAEPSESMERQEISNTVDETAGESKLTQKGPRKNVRKRRHPSRSAEKELDEADSDSHTESISTRGRRKRQQIVASGVQSQGVKRYDLRRPRNRGTANAGAAQGPSDLVKDQNEGKMDDVIFVQRSEDIAENLEPQSTGVKTVKILDISQIELEANIITVGGIIDAPRAVVDEKPNENPNDAPKCGDGDADDDDEKDGTLQEDEDEDSSDGGTYSEHPGEASIGKKIWTFLTT